MSHLRTGSRRKLKKAWSLSRRSKTKLSNQILDAASKEFYGDEPLKNIQDWVWRFALFFTGTAYEPKLKAALDLIGAAHRSGRLGTLMSYYGAHMAQTRAQRYFDILRDYFAGWSEFSQVHFVVGHGMGADGLASTSTKFQAVKMYYGNAFEAFASSVDLLTMVNNVLAGRDFDQLVTIPLEKYLVSDKANRFDAFSASPQFTALCEERDNRLRNASHHGDMTYDPEKSTIAYHVGKGSTGELVTMTYAEYLIRCSRMHHQIITLLRLELLLCQSAKVPCPV